MAHFVGNFTNDLCNDVQNDRPYHRAMLATVNTTGIRVGMQTVLATVTMSLFLGNKKDTTVAYLDGAWNNSNEFGHGNMYGEHDVSANSFVGYIQNTGKAYSGSEWEWRSDGVVIH